MYLLLYIITYVCGLKQNHATLQLSTTRQNKAWPQGSFLTGINHHHSVVFHVFPSSPPSAPLAQRRKSRKCLLPIAEAPYFSLIPLPQDFSFLPTQNSCYDYTQKALFQAKWDRIKGKERDACIHAVNRNLQKKVWWFAVLHNIQLALITKRKLNEKQLMQTKSLSSRMWTY